MSEQAETDKQDPSRAKNYEAWMRRLLSNVTMDSEEHRDQATRSILDILHQAIHYQWIAFEKILCERLGIGWGPNIAVSSLLDSLEKVYRAEERELLSKTSSESKEKKGLQWHFDLISASQVLPSDLKSLRWRLDLHEGNLYFSGNYLSRTMEQLDKMMLRVQSSISQGVKQESAVPDRHAAWLDIQPIAPSIHPTIFFTNLRSLLEKMGYTVLEQEQKTVLVTFSLRRVQVSEKVAHMLNNIPVS